jgi:hypothetical protein
MSEVPVPTIGGSQSVGTINTPPEDISLRGEPVKDILTTGEICPPFSVYENIKGIPYTSKFFNVEDYESLVKLQDQDPDQTAKKIRFIDGFVKEEMRNKGYKDTTDSYETIIKRYLGRIGIEGDNITPDTMLKLYKYIIMDQKYQKLSEKQNKILQAMKAI